jgi:hypothetical protein
MKKYYLESSSRRISYVILWIKLTVTRAFCYTYLGFPNKQGLLIKQNLTFLSKSSVKKCPLHGPQRGPSGKETPVSRAFLYISFSVPIKGALPPGSPHRSPIGRDAPFLEPSFVRLSKPPVNDPTSRCPQSGPIERDSHFQSFLHLFLRLPAKRTPLQVPLMGPTWRKMPVSENFYITPRAPINTVS